MLFWKRLREHSSSDGRRVFEQHDASALRVRGNVRGILLWRVFFAAAVSAYLPG